MIKNTILLIIFIISITSAGNRIYLDNCTITSSDSLVSTKYFCGPLPIKDIVNDNLKLNYPFKLDKSIKSATLYLPPISYTYTLKLNGEKIYSWGLEKGSGDMSNYSSKAITLPTSILKENNNISITLHSDGTRTGINGLWIGNQLDADKSAFNVTYFNSTLIKTVGITSLIIGLLLVLYGLTSHDKKAYTIYLGLFGMSVFIGYIQFIFNAYWYNYLLLYKLSRFGSIFMSITLILIVLEISKISLHKLVRPIIVLAYIPYLIAIGVQSSKLSVNYIFNNVSNNLIMPTLIIGLLLLIFSTFKKRTLPRVLFLISYLILITTAISDLRYLTVFENPIFWKLPYGYMQMIIIGIIISLHQQFMYIKRLEEKNEDLTKTIKDNIQHNSIIAKQVAFTTEEIINNTNTVFVEINPRISGDNNSFVGLTSYIKALRFSLNLIFKDMKQPALWFDSFNLVSVIESFTALYSLQVDFIENRLEIRTKHNTLPTTVWGDKNALFAIFWEMVKIDIIKSSSREIKFYFSSDGLVVDIKGDLTEDSTFNKDIFENSSYYLRLQDICKHSSAKIDYSLNDNNFNLGVITPLKIVTT